MVICIGDELSIEKDNDNIIVYYSRTFDNKTHETTALRGVFSKFLFGCYTSLMYERDKVTILGRNSLTDMSGRQLMDLSSRLDLAWKDNKNNKLQVGLSEERYPGYRVSAITIIEGFDVSRFLESSRNLQSDS